MIAGSGLFRPSDQHRDALVATARVLGERHAAGVANHDRDATIHCALIDDLCAEGYHAAPIDRRYGGGSHRLVDIIFAQAALAEFDPATALGIGMHLMVVGTESWLSNWPEWRRRDVFGRVARKNAILNVFATEPAIGSPLGDARPQTILRPTGANSWALEGAKSFSTFAPIVSDAIVYCTVDDGSGDVARVLVRTDHPSIAVEHTWNPIGMRATASHTIHFAGTPVATSEVIARFPFNRRASRPAMTPWFALPVAAVYLGIARAARDEAVSAARRPRASQTDIAASEARHLIADIEHRLHVAEAILVNAAATADGDRRASPGLSPLEAAAKLEVTQSAITIVDAAVRVVGGRSLARGSRLERAWRDVRSGSVHPPTDAVAANLLADHALSTHH